MQYLTFNNNQYREFIDAVSGFKFRVGQRDHFVVYDVELVLDGFNGGTENVDWKNIGGFGDPNDEIIGNGCRMGVRTGNWHIDIELTVTGFSGTEDIDWKNIGGIDI
jgi:hypothetical protein